MTTPWKVYDEDGIMQGQTRDATFAACLVMHLPSGKVRFDGRIVWRETDMTGTTGDGSASTSFDHAAEVMLRNAEIHRLERSRKHRISVDQRRKEMGLEPIDWSVPAELRR